MNEKTRRVEFLLADAAGDWDTEIEDVPVSIPEEELVSWWMKENGGFSRYRNLAFVGVYCEYPEGEND